MEFPKREAGKKLEDEVALRKNVKRDDSTLAGAGGGGSLFAHNVDEEFGQEDTEAARKQEHSEDNSEDGEQHTQTPASKSRKDEKLEAKARQRAQKLERATEESTNEDAGGETDGEDAALAGHEYEALGDDEDNDDDNSEDLDQEGLTHKKKRPARKGVGRGNDAAIERRRENLGTQLDRLHSANVGSIQALRFDEGVGNQAEHEAPSGGGLFGLPGDYVYIFAINDNKASWDDLETKISAGMTQTDKIDIGVQRLDQSGGEAGIQMGELFPAFADTALGELVMKQLEFKCAFTNELEGYRFELSCNISLPPGNPLIPTSVLYMLGLRQDSGDTTRFSALLPEPQSWTEELGVSSFIFESEEVSINAYAPPWGAISYSLRLIGFDCLDHGPTLEGISGTRSYKTAGFDVRGRLNLCGCDFDLEIVPLAERWSPSAPLEQVEEHPEVIPVIRLSLSQVEEEANLFRVGPLKMKDVVITKDYNDVEASQASLLEFLTQPFANGLSVDAFVEGPGAEFDIELNGDVRLISEEIVLHVCFLDVDRDDLLLICKALCSGNGGRKAEEMEEGIIKNVPTCAHLAKKHSELSQPQCTAAICKLDLFAYSNRPSQITLHCNDNPIAMAVSTRPNE
ncbi:hypothetical protein FA10DRAFT_289423 [Acaromyces ingoldii]|uniref:Uncharacterized protein n=1 Tax=Acaromyces ingoldii TaxID=215250 RepID=A0A316YGF0_9BASI|nr:hypothetical protein FA10DRAFT_289423 [Acaromyces ingoldii]PWN86835.1 hypothetical protein FA10DRAFT_289423 [Acaromyces ingoldii]